MDDFFEKYGEYTVKIELLSRHHLTITVYDNLEKLVGSMSCAANILLSESRLKDQIVSLIDIHTETS